MREERLFKIFDEDVQFMLRASKAALTAKKLELDLTVHIDYMVECWRQIGYSYGFDHTTVTKPPDGNGRKILAVGDVLCFNSETGIWEV